jgi:hypothetical protein
VDFCFCFYEGISEGAIMPNSIQEYAKLIFKFILNNSKYIIPVLPFLIIGILMLNWKRSINKISQEKIDRLKRAGKYISSIFVELNDSKELLRYFLHGKKWKSRIIKYYNSLFDTYSGKLVKKNIIIPLKFRFSIFMRLNSIYKEISNMLSFFKDKFSGKNSKNYKYDSSDLHFFVESSSFRYEYSLKKLIKRLDILNTNYLLTIGSAGNGKTNLLCSFSETVIKHNQPCIFIDAKEIKGNIDELIFELFNIPKNWKFKILPELFLKFYSILLILNRKFIFVIVDAINENDSADFHSNFIRLITKLGKYKRIKILASCRSEYFNERFKNTFEEMNKRFHTLHINEAKYNNRAKNKALLNYQEHFQIKGIINESVKEKLFTSLLLMRIFFEVNEKKKVNALELRNAEIYKRYITQITEKINKNNSVFNFEIILDKITGLMIQNESYDGVSINSLELENNEIHLFKSTFDENLIINKKIKEGAGITERENEIVYFVFDELRDFCIARKILSDCEIQSDNCFSALFDFLSKLNEKKLSPLEGVLRYSYYHIKNVSNNPNRLKYCKKMLDEFGDSIQSDSFMEPRTSLFSSVGILMIIADSTSIEDFEIQFIVSAMGKGGVRNFWNLLNIMVNNEFTGNGLNVKMFFKILLHYKVDSIKRILTDMTKEKDYHIRDETPNELESFCKKILQQEKVSCEIKWLFILFRIVNGWDENIDECMKKFRVNENDTVDFFTSLTTEKYPQEYIEELCKFLNIKKVKNDN